MDKIVRFNGSLIDKDQMFARFLASCDEAFSYFYTIFMPDLFAYGISLGADEEIVKDSIQDIFVNIHFAEKNFHSVEHLKFFLLKSLKNKLYNIYSSKRVRTAASITDDVLNFSITTTVLDSIIDHEDRMAIQRKIDYLLSKLTSRQKEGIYLRYIQELEYSEIAEILGMSPTSARKLISRSLKRLRADQQLILIQLLYYHFC